MRCCVEEENDVYKTVVTLAIGSIDYHSHKLIVTNSCLQKTMLPLLTVLLQSHPRGPERLGQPRHRFLAGAHFRDPCPSTFCWGVSFSIEKPAFEGFIGDWFVRVLFSQHHFLEDIFQKCYDLFQETINDEPCPRRKSACWLEHIRTIFQRHHLSEPIFIHFLEKSEQT